MVGPYAAATIAASGITPDLLFADHRNRDLVHWRWAGFKVARLAGLSLPRIGAEFSRDHATVLHGLRTFELRVDEFPGLEARVALIAAAVEVTR